MTSVRKLGKTGLEVSVLGFGASPLGEAFGPIDAAEGERTVHAAVDRGINYFDTAPYYGLGLSEQRLGAALAGRREKVVLATKCGRYGLDDFDFSAAGVVASIDESLRRLRTDYVDLYQLHDIEFGDRRQVIEEAAVAAREVQRSGKARFIGITGLQLDLLRQVAEAVQPDAVLSYARCNLVVDDLPERLLPFIERSGAGLVNASPLLLGALTDAGPPAWHPADRELLDACAWAAAYCREHGFDIARLALRFCLDRPYVATTLVGMSTTVELERNLAALDQPNPADVLAGVERILAPAKNRFWGSGRAENRDR